MNEVTNNIRAAAKKLLEENKVDCVIGYKQGTVPLNDQPFFAYTPEEAEKLVWSNFCVSNLANFMVRRSGRIGVVAQGCVSRNIVGLLQEEQLRREDIHVIGVPCNGMLERRKIQALFPDKEILEIEEGDKDDILVKGKDFEERVLRRDVKRDNCLTCQHRNPVVHDELAREKGDDSSGGDIDRMAAPWEKLSTTERQQKFKEAFRDCIRCYACRDVCPLCYCHVCFVDESNPQWCGKTEDEADVETFHILRAFHCAGRCTDCGACESACPMDIKMRLLTSKIEKDIREMYNYQPGMDPEATPPLSVYRPNDPEDFIK